MTSHVMVVYGTRPEAIKVAPVIMALHRSPDFRCTTVVTGQHREMLDQVNELFGIVPDHDLDLMSHGQTLTELFSRVMVAIAPILAEARPDAVLVQGDTSTSTAAALAAFYAQIPVVHLEAGLRTGDLASPFPEEGNRKLTGQVAALHLTPTTTSRDNLLAENVDPSRIVVTGNTVIDALLATVERQVPFSDPRLAETVDGNRQILLVTTHRRESWGPTMAGVAGAVATVARELPDLQVVIPLHRNPVVRQAVLPAVEGLGNVLVTEPLPYGEFARLMGRAHVILSDSGGVQEEAPSLGTPVLVLRDTTERPEAVDSGTVRLVGTDPEAVVAQTLRLLCEPEAHREMSSAINPYGDGTASFQVLAAIRQLAGGTFGNPSRGAGLAIRPVPRLQGTEQPASTRS